MKSIQFYFMLKEITKKEDMVYLLKLYRLSAESGPEGYQASAKLEKSFQYLKRLETNH